MMLSVIIPAYNVEAYIERCVRSIEVQDYEEYEIIIVNDGSNDDTLRICERLSKEFINIRLINSENKGVSHARNIGISLAKGEIITFIDADDWILPESFSRAVQGIKCNGLDFYQTTFQRVGDNDHPQVKESPLQIWSLCEIANSNNLNICCGGGYYKKAIIQEHKISFLDGVALGEDQIFVFSYLDKCKKVGKQDNEDYCYYTNPESATKKLTGDKLIKSAQALIVSANSNSRFRDRLLLSALSQLQYLYLLPDCVIDKIINKELITKCRPDFIYVVKFGSPSNILLLTLLNVFRVNGIRMFKFIYNNIWRRKQS